ncbi:MAG: N-acetylmuramoyl-L-alanine amidase [Lachnospiraceae bacterium]|nr:N-acetylmuramoyl-L-alanine amidase [Lachnospiraceae bacterium]
MATYNVHAGHNFKVPGASGMFSETEEDRKVKDAVISKLRQLGHTVYDCTDNDGVTQSQNLANIVRKCNSHSVDLDISIHFNASNGQGHGTEVLLFGNGRHRDIGQRIVNEISALGFTNRGIKDGSNLYVVKYTNALAILIECCFCDNSEDARIYNAETMAAAIVKGITGQTVKPIQPAKAPTNGRHEIVVECTADVLNRRKEPSLNADIVGKENKGYQNRIIEKRYNDGMWWFKDIAGYWISANYVKDVIYTCTTPALNRRSEPSMNSKIVGTDRSGNAHRIKQYKTADGVKWAQDIAGYWFSTNQKYMKKSLNDCNLNI